MYRGRALKKQPKKRARQALSDRARARAARAELKAEAEFDSYLLSLDDRPDLDAVVQQQVP